MAVTHLIHSLPTDFATVEEVADLRTEVSALTETVASLLKLLKGQAAIATLIGDLGEPDEV